MLTILSKYILSFSVSMILSQYFIILYAKCENLTLGVSKVTMAELAAWLLRILCFQLVAEARVRIHVVVPNLI